MKRPDWIEPALCGGAEGAVAAMATGRATTPGAGAPDRDPAPACRAEFDVGGV